MSPYTDMPYYYYSVTRYTVATRATLNAIKGGCAILLLASALCLVLTFLSLHFMFLTAIFIIVALILKLVLIGLGVSYDTYLLKDNCLQLYCSKNKVQRGKLKLCIDFKDANATISCLKVCQVSVYDFNGNQQQYSALITINGKEKEFYPDLYLYSKITEIKKEKNDILR